MPLTPLAGVTRARAFQLGLESTFKTEVNATRRLPWSFTPTINPNWTEVQAETGTIDQAVAPYRAALDVTGSATGQLFADDSPFVFSAGLMGGITPTGGGTAKTWTYAPASDTQDVFDTFTGEWGDDATGDQFTFTGGIVERIQLAYPQDGGPINVTTDWRFAKVAYPKTLTAALATDTTPVPLFATDTVLSIDDAFGDIGANAIIDTMYDATVTITNNIDVKRFANGSNTRFEIANYGRGPRVVETTFTFAKSSDALVEAAHFLAGTATERFVSLKTTSAEFAQAANPYSMDIRFGGFWYTRSEQTVNNNTALQLVCRAVYDADLDYPIQVVLVNQLTSL